MTALFHSLGDMCLDDAHWLGHADLDVQKEAFVAVGHQLLDGWQRVELDRIPTRSRRRFLQSSEA